MGAYFRKVWLGFYTVILGMRVTLKYLFSHAITLQYPDEKWEIPDGFRGRLDTEIDDCIGCLACARACPVECITISTRKPPKGLDMGVTSEGTKKKLVVPQFDIDISTCLYCGLCVEACPTGCIRMTKNYEYSTYDRSTDLLLHFGKDLDPEVEAAAIERAKQLEQAEAAKKAMEADSPKASPRPGEPDGSVDSPRPGDAGSPEKKADSPDEPPKSPSSPGDSETTS